MANGFFDRAYRQYVVAMSNCRKIKKVFALVVVVLAVLFCINGISHAAAPSAAACFNVRDYGAVGDGTNLDSPAIDKAIAAAADAGGGTVLVTAGTYLSGSIHIKSNIHLVIDAGAIILGATQELQAYDEKILICIFRNFDALWIDGRLWQERR